MRSNGAPARSAIDSKAAACLVFLLGVSGVRAQSDISPLWTVHIDEVDSSNALSFERLAGKQFLIRNGIMRDHQLPVSPSYVLTSEAYTYMRFIPRKFYGELDQSSKIPDDVRKLLTEKASIFDDSIHATLRFHHNELWQFDKSSSYIPEKIPTAPGYVRIRTEWVKPGRSALYDSLVARLHDALVSIRYSQPCLVFFSSYGEGSNHFLWHAQSREQFVGTPEELLAKAFGKEEAGRIMGEWRECLIRESDADAVPRPDIIGLDVPWFGLK